MHGRFKIVGQVGLGLIVGLVLFMSPDVVIKENMEVRHDNVIEEVRYHTVETKSTKTTIPFLKNNNFDYANLVNWAGDYKEEAAWLVFVLMVIFVVTAVSNGANMTDGLDGLAAGTSAIIGVALGILAYMSSHFEFASFLNIMFIPGAEELVVYAAAFIGATVGFLWYNSYPAQVFKVGHLQHDRYILHQENTAKDRNQQLLTDDDRENGDNTSQGQATRISHKYLGRIRVVP